MRRKGIGPNRRRSPRAKQIEARIEALLDEFDNAISQAASGELSEVPPIDDLMHDLWKSRRHAGEVLARRIAEDRVAQPALGFELLNGLTGPRARTYLRRIAADDRARDIVRFGARRRAGWPESGEARRRLAFLEGLRDPDSTLIRAISEAVLGWPPRGEILQEVVGYLKVLPTERRLQVLTAAIDELDGHLIRLLSAMLHIDDTATQRKALEELVAIGDKAAAGSIARLAQTSSDNSIREEAKAAAVRLREGTQTPTEPAESLPLGSAQRVLVSVVDGDGAQLILIVRSVAEGAKAVAGVMINERRGIADAFGQSIAPEDNIDDLVSEFEETAIELIEVEMAAARGTLAKAIEINAANRQNLAPEFELWEPFVHDAWPPPEGEPVTSVELDDAQYFGRDDLIRASGDLASHRFFNTWPFSEERTLAAMAVTPPPDQPTRGLGSRQYQSLIRQLVTPDVRTALRQRLRRQAWLLQHTGDTTARDQSLAVAAQLHTGRAADLAKQPFLRAMVDQAIARVIDQM